MKKLIMLALLLSMPALSETNDNVLEDIFVTAKVWGGCGVYRQMISFQSVTKMDGGDEFIIRFVNSEAARLGMELEEYMGMCKTTNDKALYYQDFIKEL